MSSIPRAGSRIHWGMGKTWDTTRWSPVTTVPNRLGEATDVALSAAGGTVTVAARRGALVYDRARRTARVFHDHDDAVTAVALSRDGRQLATGGTDTQVALRDLATGTPATHLRRHTAAVRALQFTPDAALLMSAGDDGTVRWWSAPDGGWLTGLITRAAAFHTAEVSPDGRQRVAGGEESVSYWPVALPPFTGHAVPPAAVTFSADGTLLATGGPDQRVIVWNRDGRTRARLSTPAAVTAVLFQADGSLVTADERGVVAVVDPAGGPAARTVARHDGAVTGLALSHTGRLGASTAADGTVQLWDPAGHSPARVLPSAAGGPADAVAFSPDGRTLAIGGKDGRVTVWDLPRARRLGTLDSAAGPVRAMAFTPHGHRLAVGNNSGTVTFWDSGRHTRLTTLRAQRGAIRGLAINAEGTLLAAAGTDGTVTLWDPASGARVATLTGHTGPVNAVAFGPPTVLASSGADPRTVVWNLDADAVLDGTCTEWATNCAGEDRTLRSSSAVGSRQAGAFSPR